MSSAELDFALIRASALLDENPAAAAKAAGEILRVSPGHVAASLLLATAARSLGDPAAALGVLEGLARGQPKSPAIQLELGTRLHCRCARRGGFERNAPSNRTRTGTRRRLARPVGTTSYPR